MNNMKSNHRARRRSLSRVIANYYLRIFAPRQVIIRQGSEVKVFRLASALQFFVALFLIASLVISSVTLYGYFGNRSQNQRNRLILQAAKDKITITTEQNIRDRQELETTRETLNYYRLFLNKLAEKKREVAASGQVGQQLSAQLRSSAEAIIRAEEEIEKNLTSLRGANPEATVHQMLTAQSATAVAEIK